MDQFALEHIEPESVSNFILIPSGFNTLFLILSGLNSLLFCFFQFSSFLFLSSLQLSIHKITTKAFITYNPILRQHCLEISVI